MKRCSKCKEEKSLEEYENDKRVKSGKISYCRDCNRAMKRKWTERNKERVRENAVRYNREHKERISINKKRWKKEHLRESVSLICCCCKSTFSITGNYFNDIIKGTDRKPYCSIQCKSISKGTAIRKKCSWCGGEIIVQTSRVRKNNFCSMSCHGKYSASHKNYGIKRSKLEVFVGSGLKEAFPGLEIVFNDIELIGYELDIYIPKLKVAFELNGIFHYKPIFGEDKLKKIRDNDYRKDGLCKNIGIKLFEIDTSRVRNTTPKTASPFLDRIRSQINSLISAQHGCA